MLKMVDETGIIGVDMICPLGVSTPQPPNYDRVELEGTGMLVLPNSLDAPLERLELGGKTDQVQTTGKNLFDPNNSYEDLVWIRNDGEIVGGSNARTSDYIPVEQGNYAFQFDIPNPNQMFVAGYNADRAFVKIVGIISKGKCIIKIDDIQIETIRLSYTRESTRIQLERSETQTPYEPYTGGKPSPSPEYPQEIKNSGKWNEETQKYEVDVKVVGKNIFDVNYFTESENYQNKEGDATYWKYATFKAKPNTTYTVSKQKNTNVNGAINNGIYYGGALAFNSDVNSVKITTKDDGVLYVMFFYRSEDVNILKEMDIQIELGETLTEYEPYKEQTLTLTSDRPITKWDRLVEQGGQIGWLYNSANETIDGKTGKWSIQPANKIFYRTDITFPIVVPFCIELLGYDYLMGGYKKDTGITINNLGILCITLPEEVELTLDAYKQYLADNPLHVLYKDDSEEFVPLPQSEQNAIRALKAYYPTTVITVDGGELDPDIKVTYRKEI